MSGLLVGEAAPPFIGRYDAASSSGAWGRGSSLQTPDDEEIDSETFCLSCLVDEHPEAGRGLDLAREFGAAERINGDWAPDPG